MEFQKETIMGQVLTQVQADESNEEYFAQIDDLLEDIADVDYIDIDSPRWHKHGVIVTNRTLSPNEKDPDWIYVQTEHVEEYSWLIFQLEDIYQPDSIDANRLYTTIGYLLNTYTNRTDSLSEILRLTTVTSTVFLHPDHVGLDRFKVHPIDLPPFGTEF